MTEKENRRMVENEKRRKKETIMDKFLRVLEQADGIAQNKADHRDSIREIQEEKVIRLNGMIEPEEYIHAGRKKMLTNEILSV